MQKRYILLFLICSIALIVSCKETKSSQNEKDYRYIFKGSDARELVEQFYKKTPIDSSVTVPTKVESYIRDYRDWERELIEIDIYSELEIYNIDTSLFEIIDTKRIEETEELSYSSRIIYVISKFNNILSKAIENEIKNFLYNEVFYWLESDDYINSSMQELVESDAKGFFEENANDLFSNYHVLSVLPYLFHNDELTSIAYIFYNSSGGSLTRNFTLSHVFDNVTGKRLCFDDLVKPENREEFFRIANEAFNEQGGRWYNPFNFNYEGLDYIYDDVLYEKKLKKVIEKSFYFTDEGLVFSYNLYDEGGDDYEYGDEYEYQYGKTELFLDYEDVKKLILYY